MTGRAGGSSAESRALAELADGMHTARAEWIREARHVLVMTVIVPASLVLTVWFSALNERLSRTDDGPRYQFGIQGSIGFEIIGTIATLAVAIHILATIERSNRTTDEPLSRLRQRVHIWCLEVGSGAAVVVGMSILLGSAPDTLSIPALLGASCAVVVVGVLAVDARLEWRQLAGSSSLEAVDRAIGVTRRREQRRRLALLERNWSVPGASRQRWGRWCPAIVVAVIGAAIGAGIRGGWPTIGWLVFCLLAPVAALAASDRLVAYLLVGAARGSGGVSVVIAAVWCLLVASWVLGAVAVAAEGDGDTALVLGWLALVLGMGPVAQLHGTRRGPAGGLNRSSVLAGRVVHGARRHLRRMDDAAQRDRERGRAINRSPARAGVRSTVRWSLGWTPAGAVAVRRPRARPRRQVRRLGWLASRRLRPRP